MSSFIPRKDLPMLQWMQGFSSVLSANPSTYLISASDAAAIADAVNAFNDAMQVLNEKVNHNPVNINIKNTTRNAALQICRQYAALIKYNAGISDAAKIAAGVPPVNPNREPRPVPTTSPILNVIAATPGAHTLRFADSLDPNRKSKPFGAANLQLFVAVTDGPIASEAEASFLGAYTRNPIAVAFTAEDDGKLATYIGRWASATGDTGPFSVPVSMRISAPPLTQSQQPQQAA